MDLRADVTGGSLKDWKSLDGRIYLRLDYADIAAWGNWLPLPVPIERGEGALRMWVDVKASQPASVVADLELTDVQATLDPDLAPLTLSHLAGRVRWKIAGTRTDVSAQGLSFALPGGSTTAPANFTLVVDSPQARGGPRGRMDSTGSSWRRWPRPRGTFRFRPRCAGTSRGSSPAAPCRTRLSNGPARSTRRRPTRPADGSKASALRAQDAWPGVSNASGSIDFDADPWEREARSPGADDRTAAGVRRAPRRSTACRGMSAGIEALAPCGGGEGPGLRQRDRGGHRVGNLASP